MSSSTSNVGLSMRQVLEPRQLPALLATLYRRAPASVMTLSSLLVSYLANLAYLDYSLYRALGEGGMGKPSILKWLIHTLVLRPLSMSEAASRDPSYLPLNDSEWDERVQSGGGQHRLDKLPQRRGKRPAAYGLIPHRQIEEIEREGSERQKQLIGHLEHLAARFSSSLTLALSSYEHTTSPCLFVTHAGNKGGATPSQLARLYLSGNPPPRRMLDGVAVEKADDTKHELAHIHVSEGSLHVVLSPQDARRVVEKGWGQLHRLAGLSYRGHYFPPYWLPNWLFRTVGGQSKARWGYLQGQDSRRGKLIPPTYCMIYAPKSPEQVEWVQAILDSSVSWAIGQPL